MDIDKRIVFGKGMEYKLNHTYRYGPGNHREWVQRPWFLLYYLNMHMEGNLCKLKNILDRNKDRQKSEWYGWLQRRLHQIREEYYLINHAFHYIDKIRKTGMTETEYFERVYIGYHKHLRDHGYQGYTGEKAIKVLKEYWTNLMQNVKKPKEIKRETKIGKTVKVEVLGKKWGEHEEISRYPQTYYYYEKKNGELRLSINFHEYLEKLHEIPKSKLLRTRPVMRVSEGDDTWEELD